MEHHLKQYSDEEAAAALALLFLARSSEPSNSSGSDTESETRTPSHHHSHSPTPSDVTGDLIIDESEIIEEEEEEQETLTDTLTEGAEATEEEEENRELTEFLANYTTESLINRMAMVGLCAAEAEGAANRGTQEESNLRQRLEPFINEEEVHGTKYHASMRRSYASAERREAKEQMHRDKNNTASRLSRIRLRNAEQNLQIEAQSLDEANMAQRMKKALLLHYAQTLHNALRLKPMDFNRPVKEIFVDYGLARET